MTGIESVERTSRVVSAISGAHAAKRELELKPLAPVFEELADRLGSILQDYTLGLVKCSVSGLGTEILKPEDLQPHGSPFKSAKGEVSVYFRADRAFDSLLCEMCFGGSGAQANEADDNGRPPSKVETLLRAMVLDALHGALPAVFAEVAKTVLTPAEPDASKSKRTVQKASPHVRASLLVNVFSASADLEVLLPLREMESIVGTVTANSSARVHDMASVLGKCPFEVTVALPPQGIGLRDLMALSVGSMLKLQSTPSDLSYLCVSGVVVGKGRLSISSDRLGVLVT